MVRALDLFCGGGGAALGLLQAGFDEVVGIDIKDHSRVYPGDFILGDALEPPVRLEDFDFVWASPPCQAFSIGITNPDIKQRHKNLIPETRQLLVGHKWTVIENVPGAPIRPDLTLTGQLFGLANILRKRIFETSWAMLSPVPVKPCAEPLPINTRLTYGSTVRKKRRERGLPAHISVARAREAMGISTEMTGREVGEAIPPAYAKYIGEQAIQRMELAA